VGNAVKFTERGAITIRATLLPPRDTRLWVRFAVSDTGIGIAAATCEQLFEPFTQADSSATRKYGGTGLGLAISKRLVELMGGEIALESVEGQGSTFYFTLPLASPEEELDPTEPLTQPDLRGLRVLVVESDPVVRARLLSYLAAWEMKSGWASNGAAALDVLRGAAVADAPYDLVLVAQTLARGTGEVVARAILDDLTLQAPPLILLADRPDAVPQEARANFAACLPQPVEPSALLDAIVERARPQLSGDSLAEADPGVGTPAPGGPRILLVEDHFENRRLAVRQLQKLGYEVRTANNGAIALDLLAGDDEYALILMDCQMPELDGFATSRRIRDRERASGRHIPIIAVTANALREDRERCLAAGMDDYLSKPVMLHTLEHTLHRWLGRPDQVPP
jgi:CheY-like chemotaxis protein